MKKILLLLFLFSQSLFLSAQLNVSYVGDLGYNNNLSDIWGYVAPDSTEYALVGVRNGFSIVSLDDPSNPTEVAFIPGDNSTWRDIKTWGEYAYVTTDTGDDGLLVVDLSDLPNSAPHFFWTPNLLGTGPLETCHNIYIDEFGYAYLAGCNVNGGGILYIDVFSNPGNPVFAGAGASVYSHDVYVRDNKSFSSEINNGVFSIYDVTDKSNTQLLGSQATAFDFTHNAWLSDDGNILFTTDELANAPVGSYDVSDPSDIKTLDQFVPFETLGDGVIPHNVHVWNDWIIISYYTDGCIIVDGSNPENLIEVGNFDTFIPPSTGFQGAWGAYPFLPSGLILITDIGNGLYVLEPNYVRACWLEGNILDASNGAGINDADITILNTNIFETSSALGEYKTGTAIPGTYDVMVEKVGYESATVQATLENGVLTMLDIELTPLIPFAVTGVAQSAVDGSPIPNAQVVIQSSVATFKVDANNDGEFSAQIFEGDYNFFVGAWGYLHTAEAHPVNAGTTNDYVFLLEEGYQDDFIFDFNWLAFGDASTGLWEIGEPVGTQFGGSFSNPDEDISDDFGTDCYVTGNGGGNAGSDDIDDGTTILRSPIMDLSTYNQPLLSYYTWFVNGGGQQGNTPNDSLIVSVTNGLGDEVVLEMITDSEGAWRPQSEFDLSSLIEITSTMRVQFLAGDYGSGHIAEAAIDAFLVIDGMPTSVNELKVANLNLRAVPNPFNEQTIIQFDEIENGEDAVLKVFNLLGQNIETISISENATSVELNNNWKAGIYFVTIELQNRVSKPLKLIKQ